MVRVLASVTIAAVFIGLLLYSQRPDGRVVVSGFIEADEIRVGSRVGGRVRAVHVEEGQTVAEGELLVELEPFDLLEQKAQLQQSAREARAVLEKLTAGFRPEEIAQARARRDQMQANADLLQNGPRPQEIAAAESDLRLAEAELDLARKSYARAETLFGRDAIDRNMLDEAATGLTVAQSRAESRHQQLALLKEGSRSEDIAKSLALLEEAEQELALRTNGYRSEEIAAAEARYQSAEAAVRAVERQMDELKIVSPAKALVEAIDLEPGDLLSPGVPAVSLVESGDLWVRAYVPEGDLDLQYGQTVSIAVDSFRGRTFSGEITFIARRAEFTPNNVQTADERVKQVFRIKVQLRDGQDVLRPGMSADVVLQESGRPS